MRRPELPCPHCGARMPRLTVWQAVPANGRPNYHCTECGEDSWFPYGTRLVANVTTLAVMVIIWPFTQALFEMDTRHPDLMGVVIFALLGGGVVFGVWISGWVCAGSRYLVRSNYESIRPRVRRKSVRPGLGSELPQAPQTIDAEPTGNATGPER